LDVVKTAKSVMVYPGLSMTADFLASKSMRHSFHLPPNARVLITGAAGYVGQALVKALAMSAPSAWQWVLTDSHEIEKLKNISERKSPPDFQNRRSGIKQILLPKS
jgi:nucleoside-diphosphate-sugar epimerase